MKKLIANYNATFERKSIPCLDGIRGLSCLFVIIGHFSYLYAEYFINAFGETWGKTLMFSIGNQYTGVSFFFVLSGFLITNILLKEYDSSGTISYKTFFIKRVFRIFPAYYFYFLITFAILLFTELSAFSYQDIWASLTYTHNYLSDLNPWFWGHFWSLAVEEQFYLVWPLMVLSSYKLLGKKMPIAIILASPIIRVAWYFLFPEWRGRLSIMTHTRFDSLVFGCLLAYYYREVGLSKLNFYILRFRLHWLALIQVFFLSRFLQILFGGKYMMPLGFSLDCLGMVIILIYVLENKGRLHSLFNHPLLVHIGALSYSLYLWHMPFAWSRFGSDYLIARLVAIYICALFSFFLIETPFMNLRSRYLKKHS